jgi:myo-inositol-1-phosphate synthase
LPRGEALGEKIRLAIVGCGRAAASFVRSIYSESEVEGIWHPLVGNFRVSQLEVVACHDIDRRKVGRPLAELAGLGASRPDLMVLPGLLRDEPPPGVEPAQELVGPEALAEGWAQHRVDVVVNLITSGGVRSSRAYAEAALRAGASFVNATPARIASDPAISESFRAAGLVVVGDDLMSQLGGTSLHRGLIDFLSRRGVRVLRSYELDVGGGLDTLATLRDDVKELKRSFVREALRAELPYPFQTAAGTMDYVEFLQERRVSYIYLEGRGPLGSEFKIDVTLRSLDPANAVNILLDVTRAVHYARLQGRYGAPLDICAYGFKAPPTPLPIREADALFTANYVK